MDNRKYKFEIGQTFTDYKRDLTIVDRIIKPDYTRYYKYHCNKCGNENWMKQYHLISGTGCNVCKRSQKIIKGINDVATTNPEIIKYLYNKEDGYIYSKGSHKEVLCKCPLCGDIKPMRIGNIVKDGFYCNKCSDGFPYTEKIMYNILRELKIDFKFQLSNKDFNWCKNYRYDFYFELNNKKYIIETHGKQHYKETNYFKMNLKEQQEIDKNKKELALKNNIDNYIEIDCSKSELEFIKNNILNSEINNLFDLSKIDWNKCEEYSLKNMVKEVCDYWYLHNNINNEGLTTIYIGEVFKLNRGTITKYLKNGTKLGWCNYNPEKERLKQCNESNRKKLSVFLNGEKLGSFNSIKELSSQSESIFGIYLVANNIGKAMKENKEYKGFTFKREN